jgi:hypothetical protein
MFGVTLHQEFTIHLNLPNMKKTRFILAIITLFISGSVFFAACTKEGPAGKDGKDGVDGEAGINGTDGTATCIQCHDNTQALFAKTNQWAASTHATGGNYARNIVGCADCHTSQGFLTWASTGAPVAEKVMDPNPINCYTCHDIHKTFTTSDWALTTTAPVTMLANGTSVDFGAANLCANCHQGRAIASTIMPTIGGPDITLTSAQKRYGYHHGPQANLIGGVGKGGFELGSGYANSAHSSVENGCITCHLAPGYGNQAGGHVMSIGYESNGAESFIFTGCDMAGCHEGAATTGAADMKAELVASQEEVQVLIDSLHVLLMAKGIASEGNLYAKPGTYTSDVCSAFINWQMITEDRSAGIHNPKYIKKLLQNSIEAIN